MPNAVRFKLGLDWFMVLCVIDGKVHTRTFRLVASERDRHWWVKVEQLVGEDWHVHERMFFGDKAAMDAMYLLMENPGKATVWIAIVGGRVA